MVVSPRAKINQEDLNRLRRTLYGLATKYAKMEKRVPMQLAKMGSYYAKGIAPYMTGATMKSISYRTLKGKEAQLFVDETTLFNSGTNIKRMGEPVNYVKIMHRTRGNMGKGVKIKSGDPVFMYTTRKYLQKELGEMLRISLGQKK
jgi:hypothetical protein